MEIPKRYYVTIKETNRLKMHSHKNKEAKTHQSLIVLWVVLNLYEADNLILHKMLKILEEEERLFK